MTPLIDAYTRDADTAHSLRRELDACDPARSSRVRIVTDAALRSGDALAPRCLLHDAGLSLEQRIVWASARAGEALCLHIAPHARPVAGSDDPSSPICVLPCTLIDQGAQALRARLAMLHRMSVRHVIAHVVRPDDQARLIGAAERCALISGPASLLTHLIARERIAGRLPFAPSPPIGARHDDPADQPTRHRAEHRVIH